MPAKPAVLPVFLQRNSLYLVMFGFINGVRFALPGETVTRALDAFIRQYQLDLDPETLRGVYNRMQNELVEMQRTRTDER